MKPILTSLTILMFALSCQAQRIISLEEAYTYSRSADGIPEDVSYVKDTNNRLDQFVGTWKGSANGKYYTIQFVKLINYGEYSIKWDEILGNILITDTGGNVLHNSFGQSYDAVGNLTGLNFQRNTYMMYFAANGACNDSGNVFVEVKKLNPNEMTLYFMRDTEFIDPIKCPNYTTYVPLLPKDKMTLVKQ